MKAHIENESLKHICKEDQEDTCKCKLMQTCFDGRQMKIKMEEICKTLQSSTKKKSSQRKINQELSYAYLRLYMFYIV